MQMMFNKDNECADDVQSPNQDNECEDDVQSGK